MGYRVNSSQATQFRIWATQTLREFIIKGFVLDDERLELNKRFGKDYFDELLEKIQEIRARERRFYLKENSSPNTKLTPQSRSYVPPFLYGRPRLESLQPAPNMLMGLEKFGQTIKRQAIDPGGHRNIRDAIRLTHQIGALFRKLLLEHL